MDWQRRILLQTGLVSFAGGPLKAAESSRPERPAIDLVKDIAAELKQLRKELLEDRIERQEDRVRALEQEFGQVRSELQNSEQVQHAQSQEMLQLDQRLLDPALPDDERSQLESVRAEASATNQADQAPLLQKEADVGEKLRRERARLASLREAARALSSSASQ